MPFYIDFGFKKIPYTLQKMICSSLFLFAGIFAFGMCDFPNNWFFRLIIVAFIFSWIGDLALAKVSKGLRFIIGLVSFLIAHICYIIAFHFANQMLFGNISFLTKAEAFAVILVFALFVCLKFVVKVKFGGLGIAVAVYALTISLMLVKAFSLGLRALSYGSANSSVILYVLSLAAVLFVISDAVLVLILFKGKYNQMTELINIATYYAAQLLFAFSMIPIDSAVIGIS